MPIVMQRRVSLIDYIIVPLRVLCVIFRMLFCWVVFAALVWFRLW